ncbi:MAG: hypothetical protein JO262_06845 [Solirubrobacterales bacterium]|nr:hypothetical protein [Solirubrobacterales bacterium]
MSVSSRRFGEDGRQLNHAPARATPLVKVGASEEQLAARPILVSGDGPLSRELPQRVSVDTEIFRRAPGIEPLGDLVFLCCADP